jgi:8-oxo-dGTP diphosphatase
MSERAAKTKFRIRCAAVLIRGDKILLVKHEKDGHAYWLLPGGGLEPGETLAQATERELHEECGVTIRCERLLLISESLEPNRERQIINIVFLAELVAGEPHLATQNDARLVGVDWVRREALASLTFYPDFREQLLLQWEHAFSLTAVSLGNLWKA